ncbi:hypothetical protein CCMA1212_010469, partial [Trichoderma ghanense]
CIPSDGAALSVKSVIDAPSLRDSIVTIGALNVGRCVSVKSSPEQESSQLYLQQRLGTRDATTSEDVAWISFILGLFEGRLWRPSAKADMQLKASQLLSKSSGRG